jgi:hypothetical protein
MTVIAMRDREVRVGWAVVVVMSSTLRSREGGRQSGESWVRWDICPARWMARYRDGDPGAASWACRAVHVEQVFGRFVHTE